MRRIAVFIMCFIIMVVFALSACTFTPSTSDVDKTRDMSKNELVPLADDCCKYVAKKYVYHYALMSDHHNTRLWFGQISNALSHGHPVCVRNTKYEILDFNSEKKHWPVKIQCEIIVEPSAKYDSEGLNRRIKIDAVIRKDDFGHYTTQVIRPTYASD